MPGVNWEVAGETVRYNSEVVIYCDCWISDCKLQGASCRISSILRGDADLHNRIVFL
jgi:hypothetical protein